LITWRSCEHGRRAAIEPSEQIEPAPQEFEAFAAVGRALAANVNKAVQVRQETLRHLIVALLAEGHVLVEDYPGVGKTALARALARSIDCQFARIQCTSDLLPADVVGTNVYDQREQRFEFRPGPVFANVVLVDEINRASPKTQSGLLECMQERRVTVDVHTHELARPFLVLATQNPIEYEGTYPLPEAQVDRFMVRISLGYPERSAEIGMLAQHETGDQVLTLRPVATAAEVLAAQDAAGRVRASSPLRDYIVRLLWRTREDARVDLGASPRAGLLLLRAAKAHAMLAGRDHALPDDVQALAVPVLAHRLVLAPETPRAAARDVIEDAVSAVRAL
jgi:MoxR-like ATPase